MQVKDQKAMRGHGQNFASLANVFPSNKHMLNCMKFMYKKSLVLLSNSTETELSSYKHIRKGPVDDINIHLAQPNMIHYGFAIA
jgi:hypothetical protein